MGSPFVMGLNGLVLRNVAGYVRRLEFVGEWKEDDLEEFSRRGRVPDSSIILNTLVRVAIERATNLRDLWYARVLNLPKKGYQLTRIQLGAQYEDAADHMASIEAFQHQEPHSQIPLEQGSQTDYDSSAAAESCCTESP